MNKTEKVTFQNSRGLKLAGVFHAPEKETESTIIMSHGFTGDKDEWGTFVKAAEVFCNSGFSVFRFDFGGSGESEKTSITVEKQVGDLKSAIHFVKQKGYLDVGLLGLSLGGLCSVLAFDEQIKTIVLWAPVTKAKTPTIFKDRQMKTELDEKGYVMIKNRVGREFKIDRQYLKERETINQRQVLSRIKCPVLIIHGAMDDIVPLEHSESAIPYLPEESNLEIIENADHGLNNELDKVISLSLNWFKTYL